MKLQGKISNWNDDRGFGFVEPNGGGERAFVHIKAFNPPSRRPVNGEVIIYEIARDNNNRYKAENIQFSRDISKSKTRKSKKPKRLRRRLYCCLFHWTFCVRLKWKVTFSYSRSVSNHEPDCVYRLRDG